MKSEYSKMIYKIDRQSDALSFHLDLKWEAFSFFNFIFSFIKASQFFANVYLDKLDQYIKHQLKCKYYLRYADDFILLARTQQQLEDWQGNISHFLQQHLQLNLKQQVKPQTKNNGADFLGFIIRSYYILVRKRVLNNLKEKLNLYQKELFAGDSKELKAKRVINLSTEKLNLIRATLASYIGHFKHADSLKLVRAIWRQYPWLAWLYCFNVTQWQLQIKYQPPKHYNFKQQLRFFRDCYPTARLKIQKGRQSLMLLPQVNHYHATLKQINIVQTGYNHIGIQQRCVQQLVLNKTS